MLVEAKIQDWSNARRRRAAWSVSGRKTVFTNGCFDLIHSGHLQYLQEAKALGDYLIIGLNSDASVKQLKGESRPIFDEQSRAKLLASLFFVDMVVLFEEQTPLELIQNLRPDILVKGGDYAIDQIVGAKEVLKWSGKVEVLSFLEGHSTSEVIAKIKKEG